MFDTHAHFLCYKEDEIDDIINEMPENNLDYIVNIATTIDEAKKSIELANKYDRVYTAIGLYPEYSLDVTDEDLIQLEELAKNEKVVAIGEIGLDYHSEEYDKESQKKIFVKQLEIADRLGLPFCIHCRKAVEDLYQILYENKNLINHSGIMHCYSEGAEWVQKFLDLGLVISFSGNITYKKTDKSVLKYIPIDKIVVETDAPYLTPEPFRGKTNYPKFVNLVAKKIAEELEIDFNEFDKQVTKTAKSVYFKIKNK